jgi:thiol-disulfide isomerase/thioredoxin
MEQFLRILLLFISLFIFINKAYSNVLIDEYPPVPIPEIEFRDINGKAYSFERFEGNVLLLHFWATWCSSCIEEMKHLDQLQKALRKESIIVLPISEDFKGVEVVKEFYKNHKLKNLLSFMDKNNELFALFEVSNLPTSFIIDIDGQNIAKITGAADWQSEEMINLLKSYVQQKHSINLDYMNVLKEQNPSSGSNPSKLPKKLDDIPPEAITHIGPVENEEGKGSAENNYTNIQNDQFSLKVKRPVNLDIINPQQEGEVKDND